MKRLFKGFAMSLSMYSVLPAPMIWASDSFCWVIPSFPIVGLIIGVLWYAAAWVMVRFNLPLVLTAAVILLLPQVLSGFIHMDGYMDTSDAVFSRAELSRKQEILKDSNVGAFAVIMFGVYLLLGFSAVYSGLEQGSSLIILPFLSVLSRCITGIILLVVKPMSTQGFAAMFKENTKKHHVAVIVVFTVLALVISFLVGGIQTIIPLIVLIIAGILCAVGIIKQLGGISGDLCGCIIVVSELSALIAWAIVGGLR